jgi:hypothetical protein
MLSFHKIPFYDNDLCAFSKLKILDFYHLFCSLNVGAVSFIYILHAVILIEVNVLQGIHFLMTEALLLVLAMMSLVTMHIHISQTEAIPTRTGC